MTIEIADAATRSERNAADGFPLAQLANQIAMRNLVGTWIREADGLPLKKLTSYDCSLRKVAHSASRNSSERRVIADIARTAVRAERAAGSGG
jgi:hypothetical protein